jgi:hypothetical protein
MKLVANFKRTAGYGKKPIEAGETFECDSTLGTVLVWRGEAKIWHAPKEKPEVKEAPKKETAVAPKLETRSK